MSSPTKTKDFLRKSREMMKQSRDDLKRSGGHEETVPISIKVSPKKKKAQARTPQQSETFKRVVEEEEETVYITLVCKDDYEIIVPHYIAYHSGLIKRMFEGLGSFREAEEKRVSLAHFSANVVEKIFSYSFEDFILNEGHRHVSTARRRLFNDELTEEDADLDFSPNVFGTPPNSVAGSLVSVSASPPTSSGFELISTSPTLSGFMPRSPSKPAAIPRAGSANSTPKKALPPRIVFAIEMDPDEVMEVVMACHYLDIPDLLETACKMVAANISGLDSLQGVPPDVVHQIYSYLSPDELVEVESSDLHKTAHNALDTTDLWMKAVEKRGWTPYDIALINAYAWSNEVRESKLFLESDPSSLKDSLTLELAEDFAGVHWKELYLIKSFHHRMASFTSNAESSVESLEAFHSWCLPHLRTLQITPSFVQLADLQPLYFVERTPCAEYVILSDHAMDKKLMQQLATIIEAQRLPKLKALKLARCGLTDDSVVPLLSVITSSQVKLERLDLSENKLTDKTLMAFAALLKDPLCSLKFLSLRDNKMSSPFTDRIDRRDASTAKVNSERPCALGAVLEALGENQSQLKLLDVAYNNLNLSKVSAEQATKFGDNESLVYLLINDNRLVWDQSSSEIFVVLAQHLPKNLGHMNLNYTGIDETHVVPLVEAINVMPSLRHLVLSDNSFGRDASDALGALLRSNVHLRSLNLANNALMDSGARALSRFLEMNSSLVALRLERNRIGRAAVDLVQAVLRSKSQSKLRTLDLRSNGITGEVAEQVRNIVVSNALRLNVVMDFGD